MIIEIIKLFVFTYLLVAFLLAALIMITNYKNLKNLNWWELLILFTIQPIIALRKMK